MESGCPLDTSGDGIIFLEEKSDHRRDRRIKAYSVPEEQLHLQSGFHRVNTDISLVHQYSDAYVSSMT